MCWKLGPQCSSFEVREPLREGPSWAWCCIPLVSALERLRWVSGLSPRVQCQPVQHSEILSQKEKEKKRGGAKCKIIRPLWVLPLEGINTGLMESVRTKMDYS